MPKDFTIDDAIDGGMDMTMGMPNMLIAGGFAILLIVLIYMIWAGREHATNSNSAVGLQDFSAGSVGGDTSAPLDLYNSSIYARNLQDVNQFNYTQIDPAAKPGDPGSAAWYVLHSDIMQCGAQDNQSPWKWLRTDVESGIPQQVIEMHPSVLAAKQAVVNANPNASAASVNSAPIVTATKQAVANAIAEQNASPDSALGPAPVIAPMATPTVSDGSAGMPKSSESFLVGDKCPAVGLRIEDYLLTQSMMGY